jgi:histone H1/5
MTDASSTGRKDKAHAKVSSNDVQSTERAAVEAEERAHRAKQALKKAKKEAKKAHKAARRARKAAAAASKAFTKATRVKKSKGKTKAKAKAKTKAKAKGAGRSGRKKGVERKKVRVVASARKKAGPALEPMEEPDTFVLGQSAAPETD